MPDGPARVTRSTAQGSQSNRLTVLGAPLCFSISRYRTYENFSWNRFYGHRDYGEIGSGSPGGGHLGYMGDHSDVEPMRDGYVYIYREKDRRVSLWKVFAVASGKYQEVDATGSTVNYGATKGPKRDYIRIDNYYPGETSLVDPIIIVDSDIKLSEGRLRGKPFSIERDPDKRGYRYQSDRARIRRVPDRRRSGAQLLDDYRNRRDMPDLWRYDLERREFEGQVGFDLRRPHAFKEAERRNQIYSDRVENHETWLNGDRRNKEAYIHQTIVAVLRKDRGRASKVNKSAMDAWKREDGEQYRRHYFPLHYGVESLVAWLEDPMFEQWLLDYNHSEDDDVQLDGFGAYVSGILNLSLSGRGRKYLADQLKNDGSFFNIATHVPTIRSSYFDPAAHSNFAVEVRKMSNVIFAGLQEFGGLIVKDGRTTSAAQRIADWANARGARLAVREGRIAKAVGGSLGHIDTDGLARWATRSAEFADSFKGRSIITCFEVINLGIAMKGVIDAYQAESGGSYHTNLFFSLLNASGAVADIAASGLLEKYTARVMTHRGWAASKIYYLAVFSGLVDFLVGVRSAKQEFDSGDWDTAVGWAVFSVGGAIVAVGGYMQVTGATVTVGSGGTAVVPGGAVILIGFLVEAIGLAWVWLANDDELDEWLIKSKFGTRPGFRSVDEEIEAINVLMCKFEMSATFISDFRVRIDIEPRLFTEDSVMELTGMKSHAEARYIEYFIGERHDLVTGMAGLGSATIRANGGDRRATVQRDGGRISKLSIELYSRQDIDAISGHAHLKIGPGGYIHGFEKKFKLEKGSMYD